MSDDDKSFRINIRDESEDAAPGEGPGSEATPSTPPAAGAPGTEDDPVIVAVDGEAAEGGEPEDSSVPPILDAAAEELGERQRYMELLRERRRLEEELKKSQAALYQEQVRVQAAEEKLNERQAQLVRAQAEFQNFRRRVDKEKEDTARYAFGELLADLLPVLDNLDRAMSAPPRPETVEDFHKGITLIQKQLKDLLLRYELQPLATVGEPFDPNQHEAVTRVPSREVPPDHVVTDLQRGYRYKDRLLRPALVAVSSGPSEEDPAGDGGTGTDA